MKNLILILILLFSGSVVAKESVYSFSTAKKKLYKTVYQNQGKTFYCGCDWSKKKVDLGSCRLESYFPKKQRKRSLRTEADHVIPASWLLRVNGRDRQCLIDAKSRGESPRKYCQKYDKSYKQAHSDLVNLFPVVGQINADRSNKPFVDRVKATPKPNTYGQCNIKISSRGIVPPSDKKGDIARIAKYMQSKYGVKYHKRQQALFDKWDQQDPVSQEEIKRNNKIIKTQGYGLNL